jgi:hypothetical protein
MRNSRRSFILRGATLATALTTGHAIHAADAPVRLEESDPMAKSLGYVKDAAKADKVKYPKRTPDQDCAGCMLYQGKAGSAEGPCQIFSGKIVMAKGWCSAWVKKA